MSTERDFDQIARAWLDLMPDEAPDRTISAVLEAVETTPQAIRPASIPRRIHTMNRFVSAGIAAAVLIAAGAFLVVSRPGTDVGASPSPSASASGTAAGVGPLPDALRATWIGFAGENATLQTGAGPVSLRVDPIGSSVEAANFGPGHGYASTATQLGADQIQLVLARAGGDCAAGARGVYRWSLAPDRSLLTLTLVSDDCANRGIVFGRQWGRSLLDAGSAGAGFIDSMDPPIRVTLPDNDYQARTLDDFFEIAAQNGLSLMVFKNPQPFVDPCSTDEKRVAYQPGAAAFIDAFRANEAFDVSPSTSLTINGNHAVHVDIGGRGNYARCPGQPLDEYTPKACGCHFVVGQGDTDSMYLIEVGSDTFLVIVSPFESSNEQAVIESIRIPAQIPGG